MPASFLMDAYFMDGFLLWNVCKLLRQAVPPALSPNKRGWRRSYCWWNLP